MEILNYLSEFGYFIYYPKGNYDHLLIKLKIQVQVHVFVSILMMNKLKKL